MLSFFVYILKLLITLFITTVLVTDVTGDSKNKDENIKFMFFASFFTLTLISIANFLSFENSFYYGCTIIVIYFVIHSLSVDFDNNEKIKVYLICLCATLFGFGTITLTLMGFFASLVSYIVLYNSTEFYKMFFSQTDTDENENSKELHEVNKDQNIK
tara:strand:- start:494 stop:967 length:474 start_codon:yes stop_codon:yes gene_type:complete